ncbi:MAG: hypothetical protein JSR27_01280 [Proteobacteria bacterium]|nr:hypothetical protein [Pseudomonadota bacterium]
MWKWLRNGVLLAIVLAGALKLAAWYTVGRDAQRVVAELAPYADIKYDGLGAGLDGSVSLTGVSVAPKGSHRIYRADRASFDSPGLAWLLKHALLGENDLPAQFGLTVNGLSLPPEPWLDPQWLDPGNFALFASAGCNARLGASDWQRMGLDPGSPSHGRFEYRYDADQHALTATLSLSTPQVATLALETDLSRFDPAKLMKPGFWNATRIDQMAATYTDHGFLQRRNDYCAKRAELTPVQFTAQHIAAVDALLEKSRIEPDDELARLYKALVEHGGSLRLLSLPNAAFSVNTWNTAPRDELLRQLNVTARYQDKPPIMFRLAFLPAAAPDASSVATPAAEATAQALSPAAPAPPATAVASAPKEPALEPKPVVSAAAARPEPAPSAPPAAKPAQIAPNYLDRAEARLSPLVVTPPAPTVPEVRSPPLAPLAPSTPMPANAAQALVWKPGVIEQLPEAVPLKKDYTVIDFTNLAQYPGRHVRLITRGGKRIEGFVASADNLAVQMRIERGGGSALITIGRDSVSQAQLLHW